MASSAEVAVLSSVAKLAQRFGMKPSQAEAFLVFISGDNDPKGLGYYALDFVGRPTDPQLAQQYGKFASLLGMDQSMVKAQDMSGLEDIVDRALSLAPRARGRDGNQ